MQEALAIYFDGEKYAGRRRGSRVAGRDETNTSNVIRRFVIVWPNVPTSPRAASREPRTYVELALIVVSALISVAPKSRPSLTGIALGLLVNAALLLAFDLVAERRGAAYLTAIEGNRKVRS
jgi:hypothetical protein